MKSFELEPLFQNAIRMSIETFIPHPCNGDASRDVTVQHGLCHFHRTLPLPIRSDPSIIEA